MLDVSKLPSIRTFIKHEPKCVDQCCGQKCKLLASVLPWTFASVGARGGGSGAEGSGWGALKFV